MSLNGVLVTPINQNIGLLNSVFKFKTASKLHEFVKTKGGVNKTLFTLAEILTILKDVLILTSFVVVFLGGFFGRFYRHFFQELF